MNSPDFIERRQPDLRLTDIAIPENARNEVTGLPNEAATRIIAEHLVTHYPGTFGEIALDLDGLSEHNTRYGHADADRYLQTTGELLVHTLRQGDFVGLVTHPHGDEFRILVGGVTDDDQVERISQRLENALDEHGIAGSFGGTVHRAGESANDLTARADYLSMARKLERKKVKYNAAQHAFMQRVIRESTEAGVNIRDIAFFAEKNDEPKS